MLLILLPLLLMFATVQCGQGDLSRGRAENLIKEAAKKEPKTMKFEAGDENGIVEIWYAPGYTYDPEHQSEPLGNRFAKDSRKFVLLKDKGLITYEMILKCGDDAAKRHPRDPARFYFDAFRVALTSKAKSYVIKEDIQQSFGRKKKIVTLLLSEVDKIDVSGVSKPSDMFGHRMCTVDYTIHYKPTPFGEIFLEKDRMIHKGQMPFVLYDDGWRIGM